MARTRNSLSEMVNHEDNQMDLDENEASKTQKTQTSSGAGLANKTRHPSNLNIKKPRILERSLDQYIDRAKAHGLNFSRPLLEVVIKFLLIIIMLTLVLPDIKSNIIIPYVKINWTMFIFI